MNEERTKKLYGHGAAPHYTETDCNSAEHKSRIATEQMARITNPRQRSQVTSFASSLKANPR